MGWSVVEEQYDVPLGFRRWHVFPDDEQVLHTLEGETCFCDPRVTKIENFEGVFNRLVTHSSTDGREYIEDAESIKNNPDQFLPK